MVHVVTETNRHLGHADILREQLDGALGSDPTPLSAQDEADWVTPPGEGPEGRRGRTHLVSRAVAGPG